MGDSSPPQLRAPAPGAIALSPAARATPIPPLRHPPRIVTVRPPPFGRDSSRTHRHALPPCETALCFRGTDNDGWIAVDERHLKRRLSEYIRYYHEDRTHLGLGKGTPDGRTRTI